MLPCAIEYFQSSTRRLPLGRHVGLTGKSYQRLTKARDGMATYVWPTKPHLEHDLLRAGMTGLTDHADPSLTWLPSNHARWHQPGTRPLDGNQWALLKSATQENHESLIAELHRETPRWVECDADRRRALVEEWRKRWNWTGSVDELLEASKGSTPPWSAPRLIGHRGCGKTARPVLQPHST